MKNLADHIRQASKDVDEVHTSSKKITAGFAKIERVELAIETEASALPVEDLDDLLGENTSEAGNEDK